jgi:putative membrane protein
MIPYDWLKALHVIAVIAWMAGMLYLPRLYVYHAGAKPGSELSETLKVMERRLLRAIINPAMAVAWVLGLWMAWAGDLWGQPWFQVKLALVIALSTLHAFFARWRRHFAADANRHSARFYRVINEVPTLIMIVIVVMVIVKPF